MSVTLLGFHLCVANRCFYSLPDKTWISEVDVHLTSAYATGTVESCRTVSMPTTGEYALNLMCGGKTAFTCSPKDFFEFLGNNPFSPFIINFTLHEANDTDSGFTPPDQKAFACWEAPDVSV